MTGIVVDMDLDGLQAKFSDANFTRGRYALSNQMLADMDPFVPRLSGDLRTAVSVSMDAKEIYYHMQYANKMYHNQYNNYTTPGTGPYWDKKAAGLYGKAWARVFVRGAGL